MSFLDVVTRSPKVSLRLEQASVGRSSLLNGKSLRDAQFRQETGLMVVAVRKVGSSDDRFRLNPEADMILEEGDEVIVLGRPDEIQDLRTESARII